MSFVDSLNRWIIKGKHGRYLVETVDDQVHILGIGNRGNKNIFHFKKLMNKMYDENPKY